MMSLLRNLRVVHLLIILSILSESTITTFSAAPSKRDEIRAPAAPAVQNTAGGNVVVINDNGFAPDQITVAAGEEVTWINEGTQPYGVMSFINTGDLYSIYLPLIQKAGSANTYSVQLVPSVQGLARAVGSLNTQSEWSSGLLQPGESFSRAFNFIGTFEYYNSELPLIAGQVTVVTPNDAPSIAITSPLEGAVVAAGSLQVSGSVSDDGQVVEVLVNGSSAVLNGSTFNANIPINASTQTLNVIARDDAGASSTVTRVVVVDELGPEISVRSPRDRQSVYTRQPYIEIDYSDYASSVDQATISVTLSENGGGTIDVTNDLAVTAGQAYGSIQTLLNEDTIYTLIATLDDTLGNGTQAAVTFYVPANASQINPPVETGNDGWVSGVVYDSASCDADLTSCTGLPGALVTLTRIDATALAALRSQRQAEINAGLEGQASAPSDEPAALEEVAALVPGTVISGVGGFFAFPLVDTGLYWLRIEKNGYTYGQRQIEVIKGSSSATNDIYLTPLDSIVTPCDADGCNHTNSDNSIQLFVPPGAIQSGSLNVTATNFKNVEFLPSGELPAGTWETYAFNLGGASEITFTIPVTVSIANSVGFAPGTSIPLGYWNQYTQQWEHAGIGIVDQNGQRIETTVSHFSNYDLNFPVQLSDFVLDIYGDEYDYSPGLPGDEEDMQCSAGSEGCFINFKSGRLQEWIRMPDVQVLGEAYAPQLGYSTDRARPSEVIDARLSLDQIGSVTSLGYLGYELYIEGQKTATYYVQVDLSQPGELGRFRYIWDGTNAQGQRLPSGVYRYKIKFIIPYQAEYCRSENNIFGNPPDCVNGGTGIFVNADKIIWTSGTVTLDAQNDSPYGAGWQLIGHQRLVENEGGDIVIFDGQNHDEFFFPQKNLVPQGVAATNRVMVGLQVGVGSTPDESAAGMPEALKPFGSTPGAMPREDVDIPVFPTHLPPYQEVRGMMGEVEAERVMTVNVCGEINANTNWTQADSPYVVTCDVSVAAGVQLSIEPGVEVQFNDGFGLTIGGSLIAVGSSGQQIIFRSSSSVVPGSWRQISFVAGSSGDLSDIVVNHGGVPVGSSPSYGALTIASDSVVIDQATFQLNGVGIFVTEGANPTISNSSFIENTATRGPAIRLVNSAATILDSQFIGNTGNNSMGGAIDINVWDSTQEITISNSHFESNSGARNGGAISNINPTGSLILSQNTFLNNSSTSYGGAFYEEADNSLITSNIFIGNSVSNGSGGALYLDDYLLEPTATIVRGNVIQNNSARDGGGIFTRHGNPNIHNNQIIDNVADYGGGLQTWETPWLAHNLIRNNLAIFGGGLLHYDSTALPRLASNIIVENTATANNNGYLGGGGIFNGSGVPGITFGDYNIVWGNIGLDYQELNPGVHDISDDPLFVDPDNGDFHLSLSSPAIDAGDPSINLVEDFEGDFRPMGLAPDIGSDEFTALGIHQALSAAEVLPGDEFEVVLNVYNPGPGGASLTVSDPLPVQLSYVNYQSQDFTCNHNGTTQGGLLSCSGTLAAQGQAAITVTVQADNSISSPVKVTNISSVTDGSQTATGQADLWVSWCAVRLNDGPVGSDIQAAIDAYQNPGDVVKVSGRCLVPRWGLNVGLPLTLQGGWDRTFSLRDPEAYPTILDAGYQGLVVAAYNGAIVEGFVMQHGFYSDGGAVYVFGGAIIQDNIIEENMSGSGGGVYGYDSFTIQRNLIRNNVAENGGGIYTRTYIVAPRIDANLIYNNTASSDGGGIYIDQSGTVRNNILAGNEAGDDGGGLYFDEHAYPANIEHNTFWGNSAANRGGGLAFASQFGWQFANNVRNNAVINNSSVSGGGIFVNGSLPGLNYNNVWGNSSTDYNAGVTLPANDMSADPRFENAAGGDFHLKVDSPMIDAADPATDFYPDFEGDPRPMGAGGSDIGADEYRANTAFSLTGTDYSGLEYDQIAGTYLRIYPDNTRVQFDSANRHAFTLDPDGRKTAYSYNNQGRVSAVSITPPGGTTPIWVWQFTYSGARLSSITDPAGRITRVAINTHNRLTDVTFPNNAMQRFFYNAYGLLTQHVDENGQVSDYRYDDFGRLQSSLEPMREFYDPLTGISTIEREERIFTPSDTAYPLLNDRLPGSPQVPGPEMGKSVSLVDKIEYERGSLSGRTDRWGNWVIKVDSLGRVTGYSRGADSQITRMVEPDGDCVEMTYDSLGNRLSESRMGAEQCALDPVSRDLSQILTYTWTYEDQFNHVASETDPKGNTTLYTYDYQQGAGDAGRLISISYPQVDDGYGNITAPIITMSYNSLGLLESEVDALGVTTRYIYTQGIPDEASTGGNPLFKPGVTPVPGHLTRVIRDYGGENLTTIYSDFDGAGNPGKVVGPGGHETTTYLYDLMNRVVHETDAVGVSTTFAYDGRGSIINKVVDTGGRNITTTYSYNPEGQRLSELAIDGTVLRNTQAMYDGNRNLVLKEDSRGNQQLYLYDDADQLINLIDPTGAVITYTYTLDSRVASFIDPDGYITSYEYDPFGRQVIETQDFGGLDLVTTKEYDQNGNLSSLTDPNGVTTCYSYDALNRLVSETLDCGGLDLSLTYKYDLNGNLLSETDPRGVVTQHVYDDLNREIMTVADAGGLSLQGHYTYDSAGNLAQIVDERGLVSTQTFDVMNRVVSLCYDVSGLNLCTDYAYDSLGNVTTRTDENGVITLMAYGGFGQLLEQVGDAGGIAAATRYEYDNNLNLTAEVDANGNITRYAYSPRNEVIKEHYADTTTVLFEYNLRGAIRQLVNQDGAIIHLTYDGAGRHVESQFSTGGTQDFTYDGVGRILSAEQVMNGHTTRLDVLYNGLGHITSATQNVDAKSWTVSYDYDYAGRVYTLTYPSGEVRVRTADSLGRIDQVQDGIGGVIADYDFFGQDGYELLTYANTLVSRTDFDGLNRPARINSGVVDYIYGYDGAGNRLFQQYNHLPGQPSDVYVFDGLYRPLEVWYGANATSPGAVTTFDTHDVFTLDAVHNRLQVERDGTPQVYGPSNSQQLTNPMNRYEIVDGEGFTYDLRGNTLSDDRNLYTYDILNRLVAMSGPGGNAEYVYDALGRRVAKTVDGQMTYYIQDSIDQVLEERNGSDDLLALYTYGMGIDMPLTMERGGNTYYYHRDAQGSITALTDAAGQLVEQASYSIYGLTQLADKDDNPLTRSAVGNPYMYTGRRFDPESGNYYFRARYYSPHTGRFLQMDPIGFVDGMNLYASYFAINGSDPSGNESLGAGASGTNLVTLWNESAYWVWGGELKIEWESKSSECCSPDNGYTYEHGWQTHAIKLKAEIGFGFKKKTEVYGKKLDLGYKGPRLEAEYAFSVSNSTCGGPLDTGRACSKGSINIGSKASFNFLNLFGAELDIKLNLYGQACITVNKTGISGEYKLCGGTHTALYAIGLKKVKRLIWELSEPMSKCRKLWSGEVYNWGS